MTLTEVVPRFEFSGMARTAARSLGIDNLLCVKQRHRPKYVVSIGCYGVCDSGVDKAYPRIPGLVIVLARFRLKAATCFPDSADQVYMHGYTLYI
jgi:hypothetical protein